MKATPLLDSPVVWDHRGEIPVDSSDPGAEEENALYNVSSLTSIIDRYEGKVMRKHEMENWSKKAMKRFRVQLHTHRQTHVHTHTHNSLVLVHSICLP